MGQAQRLGWTPAQLRHATFYEFTAAVAGHNAALAPRRPPGLDAEDIKAMFRARPEHEVLH